MRGHLRTPRLRSRALTRFARNNRSQIDLSPHAGRGIPPDRIEPIARKFSETVSSALVPLHPRGTGCRRVVVPLESQRFLAEHVSLETPPSLELEVVERTAVGTKPMRYARGEIDERAWL
jgi:hypothetical protein